MEITKLFDNILDLPGIEGVCLFGTEGQVYVNRLPAFLSTELFADAQRRIVAMYETMDENFLPSDDYMLRFSERWLLLRRTDNQVLLVLGGEKANLASTPHGHQHDHQAPHSRRDRPAGRRSQRFLPDRRSRRNHNDSSGHRAGCNCPRAGTET